MRAAHKRLSPLVASFSSEEYIDDTLAAGIYIFCTPAISTSFIFMRIWIYTNIFAKNFKLFFFRTPLFSRFYCAQKCVSKFTQEIIIILDPLVKQCAGDYDFCENWCLCCFQLHIDAFNLAYCYISSSICINKYVPQTWRRSIYCI